MYLIAIKGTVVGGGTTDIPVTIAPEHSSIGGGIEDLKFTLTRTGDTADTLPVTVTLTQDQMWLGTSDLTHDVTFAANSATKELKISYNRFSYAPTTSGNITATVSGTGVTGGTTTVEIVSIANPPITVAFDKTAYSFQEGDPEDEVDIYVTATLDSAFTRKLLVDFIVAIDTSAGTAMASGDYGTVQRTLTFTPAHFSVNSEGNLAASRLFGPSGNSRLAIVDDEAYEDDEAFTVRVRASAFIPDGMAQGKKADGTFCALKFFGGCDVPYPVTITDDDLPTLSLSASATSIEEEDDSSTTGTAENVATVTASITNSKKFATDQVLTLVFGGTATYGTHFTVAPADADTNTAGHQITLPAAADPPSVAVTLGLRHDGGDAETGTGVEVGAGLRYTVGAVTIEAQARTLVAHEASEYEEWGASGAIRVTPDASGRGLTLSIAPAWGRTGSAAERLWSAHDASALGAEDTFEADGQLAIDAGYGFGLPDRHGVLTPYAGLTLGDAGNRTMRAGTRWQFNPDAVVSVEATRHTSDASESANELRLRAALLNGECWTDVALTQPR